MVETLLLLVFSFFLFLLLKKKLKNLCVICSAVTLTWVIELTYFLMGKNITINNYTLSIDSTIIAILMGGSVVGLIYYLSAKRNYIDYFKFPLLTSLFFLVYITIEKSVDFLPVVILTFIWTMFYFGYVFRFKASKNWFKRVVECCKNW